MQFLKLEKKLPSKSQWGQFLKILTKKEKIIFLALCILLLGSGIFLGLNFYFENTEIKPAQGGIFIEGVVGSPRFINPIYAASSDIDRDISELLFSGLMKYNSQGKIVPDILEKYEIKDGGKTYEIFLKDNVFFHDGEALNADDVIFTVNIIQDPDYKSPLRANWLGIEAEKISDLGVRFKLKEPYCPFLERLTLKIIPEHIWQEISPEKFLLSTYNLNPIGSGPYKFKELSQDKSGFIKSFDLEINSNYYSESAKISEISFRFFENEEDLTRAASLGEINGFILSSPENYSQNYPEFNYYSVLLPRYFALFFNQEKAESLEQKEIRTALSYGTNKEEILTKVLKERGEIINSPILPKIYGFESPSIIYQFDLEKAQEFLTDAGFVKNDEGQRTKIIKKTPAFQFKSKLKSGSTGKEVEELQKCLASMGSEIYPEGQVSGYFGNKTETAVIRFQEKYKSEILDPWGFTAGTGIVGETTREKLNEICFPSSEEIIPLSFTLTTTDDPTLKKAAENLKEQWEKLGIELEITTVDDSTLKKETIPERNYQMLLFGEALGAIPDPLPFWHSSQKEDPGLNLVGYENKEADDFLEKARTSLDFENLSRNLQGFQEVLIADIPCIFLYNPENFYFVSKEIKGVEVKMVVDLSKRFSGVESWYVKTKRAWR